MYKVVGLELISLRNPYARSLGDAYMGKRRIKNYRKVVPKAVWSLDTKKGEQKYK